MLHISTNFQWVDLDALREKPTGVADLRFLKVAKGNTRRGSFNQ
jgi:hypothetical protein